MKKITKYLVFSFLMVASLVATASFTYASDVDVMYLIDDDTSTQYMLDDDDSFLLQEDGNEITVTLNIDGVESSFNTSWLIIEAILEFDLHAVDYDYLVTVSAGDEIEIGAYDRSVNVYYDQQYDDTRFSYSGIEIDASPVLNGQTAFVTTIDDPITVAEITSYISAYDETDGSLTHAIELVDSARDFLIFTVQMVIDQGGNVTQDMSYLLDEYDAGTLDEDVAGSPLTNAIIDNMYTSMYIPQAYNDSVSELTPDGQDSYALVYYVADTAGNYSVLEVSVYVKDVLSPVGIDDSQSISYTETFDLAQYLSENGVAFTDNYDGVEDLTIVIQNDDYTANKTVVGDHVVQFKATDTSGNVGYAELTISVYDDVVPTFSGPTTLTKATTETLTLSEIKAMLSANDVVDGSLTSSIQVVTDDFTGRGNLVGSYDIQFSVIDAAGNIGYHTVTVNVVDDIPPVFYVKDGYFISVSSAVDLTISDVIDILEITGQITVDGTGGITVTTLLDEYSGNENTAGIYAMSFNVTAVNGEESVYSVAIEVLNDEDDGGLVIDEDEDQLQPLYDAWDATKDWVKNNVLWTVAIGIGLVVLIGVIIGFASSKPYKHRRY